MLTAEPAHEVLTARAHALYKRQVAKGKGKDLRGLLGKMSPKLPANAPKSLVPDVQEEKAVWWPEAKRVKVRYGPFRIPPTGEQNYHSKVLNVQGMADSLTVGVKKPCDECTLLTLVADLEYADGSPANNSNGAWLHHVVLLNSGPGIIETNCGASVENIFMDGNERSLNGFALPNAAIKSGYNIGKANTFILQTELMNLQDKEKFVWMTITYEVLPGLHPDFKQGKTVWMNISPMMGGACGKVQSPWGPSNLTASQQPKSLVFSEHSLPWTAPKDGWVMSTGGHLHDGGASLDVYHNNKVICRSMPHYEKGGHGMGAKRRVKRQVKGGSASNDEIEHIAKQSGCAFPSGLPLKKGEKMWIEANYDFTKRPGMKNKKNELDEVMGIAGTLVVF
jgi:hypothetical protein